MSKVLHFLRKKRPFLLLIACAIIAQCYLQLMLPEYMGKITTLITSDSPDKINQIWINGGYMILISVGVVILATIQNFTGATLSAYVGRELRTEMFHKVNHISLTEYNKFGTATLITRTTNDIEQVKNYVLMAVRIIVMSPTYMIIGLIKTLTQDAMLSIVLAICIPLILLFMAILLKFATPLFKSLQTKIDNLTIVVRENLTGVRVIRAYNQQGVEYKKFDKANKDMTQTVTKVGKIMSFTNPLISIIFNLCFIGIYALGFYLLNGLNAGDPQIGNLISNVAVVAQYSLQIMQSFMMLAMIFIMLPQASACSKRIAEVLDVKDNEQIDNVDKEEYEKFKNKTTRGVLAFNNVTFTYPDSDTPCIENISFETKPGKMLAIIGSTGAGKSTVINLIPRFYDATKGNITLDGVDITKIPIKDLRDSIGFVPQKAVLFKGTIKDNIRFGKKDATDEEINEALSVAQTEHFISKLPKGLDSFVSQGGKNFSGGQKQRLSIARALVKKPEVYVFDDSFSALDFKTDAKLRVALKTYIGDSTMIVVAQRVSSILDADTIVVLNEGKVAGIGNHEDLLKNCPIYQDIVKSQLDPDEVEKTLKMSREAENEGGK